MSGWQALNVCADDCSVEGCSERLSDACLIVAEALVRLASGVIAGAKPAAIFNLPMRAYHKGHWHQMNRSEVDEVLRAYASSLPLYGVRLAVLYRSDKRVYLLVWRPSLLDSLLGDKERLSILQASGYRATTSEGCLRELRRRLVAYYAVAGRQGVAFPHEIGVFLGYPPEDVRGFMRGERATCKGPWWAYGDKCVAQKRFEALLSQERRCRCRYRAGEPLHALFAS